MRSMLLAVLISACAAPAWAEDILAVLERSQEQRLQGFPSIELESPQGQILRRSFERLITEMDLPGPVELRVVSGADAVIAETLQGRVIVVSEALAEFLEGERLFVLAHELGHVAYRHWSQMGLVYQKYVPGVVAQQQTDQTAELLGREASSVAHAQELEADAYGLRAIRKLGYSVDEAVAAFARLGMRQDTSTHPATRQRIAQLRAAE